MRIRCVVCLSQRCQGSVGEAVGASRELRKWPRPQRRAVCLPSVSVSVEDTTSKRENRKKSTKKEFEIDFDSDINLDDYFRKTKVCVAFITVCTFLGYSLQSSFPFRCDF